MTGPTWGTNWGTDLGELAVNTDFTGKQFTFVKLASTGYLVACSTGDMALGVIQDSPVGTTAQPVAVPVRTMAPTKVQAGGTFNAGVLLASDSAGKAVLYTGATVFTGTPYVVSGSQVLGIALAAGTSGQDTTMLFRPSGLSA